MVFGRKKNQAQASGEQVDQPVVAAPETPAEEPAGAVDEVQSADPVVDRDHGPWDISEVGEADRVDLGAILIPPSDVAEIRVEMDPGSGRPISVAAVGDQGAVRIRVFAAPRSGGTWQRTRAQIVEQLSQQGGKSQEVTGPFGVELQAALPARTEDGKTVLQPMRFVGVEGPRWLLQGTFLGRGAIPGAADDIDEVFRSVVVDRGDQAMPPGAPLPLRVPGQPDEAVAAPSPEPPLGPGPTISEVR